MLLTTPGLALAVRVQVRSRKDRVKLPDQVQYPLQPFPVRFVEGILFAAVDIEHADDGSAVILQGYHYLRLRPRIACDMTGELMDVGHNNGLFPVDPGPADPGILLQPDAGQRTLVGAGEQRTIPQEVETGPEKIIHLVVQQCYNGRHGRNTIRAILQQAGKLVKYPVVTAFFGGWVHHDLLLSKVTGYERKGSTGKKAEVRNQPDGGRSEACLIAEFMNPHREDFNFLFPYMERAQNSVFCPVNPMLREWTGICNHISSHASPGIH